MFTEKVLKTKKKAEKINIFIYLKKKKIIRVRF